MTDLGSAFRSCRLAGTDDCAFSAIDAALEAIGAGPQVSAEQVKQAFCYDELESLAESGSLA